MKKKPSKSMGKALWQAVLMGVLAAVIVLGGLYHQSLWQYFFTAEPVSYKDAVRIASPAVVNVYNRSFEEIYDRPQSQLNSLGSGVIMSSDGYILTNKHVIENAQQIIVALQTGQVFQAKLIGTDSLTDLAVLKINAHHLPTIPRNMARKPAVGDVVLAIGNPYNLGQSVSQGIISALGRNAVNDFARRQNLIQTDASINRGNSGGALINSLGELVAINTLSIGKNPQDLAEGLNFAIPINIAADVMQSIIKNGRVIRGYMGVQSNILYNDGQGLTAKGVLINAVAPQSPAALAGILPNDVILRFNNIVLHTPAQLMQLVTASTPGRAVTLDILRNGRQHSLKVIIRASPAIN